ncbi:MAG: hypothetical protein ACTHJ9_17215 [Rhodanobacter sp.]
MLVDKHPNHDDWLLRDAPDDDDDAVEEGPVDGPHTNETTEGE